MPGKANTLDDLRIRTYPDPVLRRRAKPVPADGFDNELARLVSAMAKLMYDSAGVGLAAIQGLAVRGEGRDARIAALEAENAELRRRLEALEAASS